MSHCYVVCSQTEQLTVLWILFASIVIGNIAVLLALIPNKSRKSKMNFFIKHLALAGKRHCHLEYSLTLQKITFGPVLVNEIHFKSLQLCT